MTDEVYEPSLYDIPGEVQTLSRSNLFREYVSEDLPQINHYVRQRQLGRGAVGQVYLCYKVNPKLPLGHKHRKIPVAIKELSRQPTSDDKHQALRRNAARRLPTTGHNSMADKLSPPEMRIRREIAIMKKCWHPHVVRLLEVIDDRLKDRIYLVMEYQAGGEVVWNTGPYLPSLTVDQARRVMRDVINGVEYLHYQGIIHRDIKPSNLLWSSDRRAVKIADFGIAHFSYAQRLAAAEEFGGEANQDPLFMDDSALAKEAGTPPFLAPEVVWVFGNESNVEDHPPITKAIDIWAIGVTLYCLLFGGVPFVPPSEDQAPPRIRIYHAVMRQDFEVNDASTIGSNRIPTGGRHPDDETSEGYYAIQLLDQLLQKDPRRRIAIQDLKTSSWFCRDLPNPEQWLNVTSPTKIQINENDTSAAISTVRFSMRWSGNSISRGISSLLRGVRGRGSKTPSQENTAKARTAGLSNNRSSPALPIHQKKEKGKRRDTRSRSPHNGSTSLPVEKLVKHQLRKAPLRTGSDPPHKVSNASPKPSHRLFIPWRGFRSSSSTLASPTTSPETVHGSIVPPSPVRRMHTLPTRASIAGERPGKVEIVKADDLSSAKRASSWGDEPQPKNALKGIGGSDLSQSSRRRPNNTFGIPIDDLDSGDESDASYGHGGETWFNRVRSSSGNVSSDEEDEGITFLASRRRVTTDAP